MSIRACVKMARLAPPGVEALSGRAASAGQRHAAGHFGCDLGPAKTEVVGEPQCLWQTAFKSANNSLRTKLHSEPTDNPTWRCPEATVPDISPLEFFEGRSQAVVNVRLEPEALTTQEFEILLSQVPYPSKLAASSLYLFY